MISRDRLIVLRSGGVLKLSLSDVSLFTIDDVDREFVFSVIDKLQEYEAAKAEVAK